MLDIRSMSPASESGSIDPSSQSLLTIGPSREDHIYSSHLVLEELAESSRHYPRNMCENTPQQHQRDVYRYQQEHICSHECNCGQQQQQLSHYTDSKQYEMFNLDTMYQNIALPYRCAQSGYYVRYPEANVEQQWYETVGSPYCYQETQTKDVFGGEELDASKLQRLSDFTARLDRNRINHASDLSKSLNDVIHSEGELSLYKSRETSELNISESDEVGAAGKKSGSVARRNARERKRIKNVNLAFDNLRRRVPQGSKGDKISKVETLRSAIEYIRALQDLVSDKQSESHQEEEDTDDNSVLTSITLQAPDDEETHSSTVADMI